MENGLQLIKLVKVVCEVCAGDFLLDDAPQLDIPVEVDSDQIEILRIINVIPRGR